MDSFFDIWAYDLVDQNCPASSADSYLRTNWIRSWVRVLGCPRTYMGEPGLIRCQP